MEYNLDSSGTILYICLCPLSNAIIRSVFITCFYIFEIFVNCFYILRFVSTVSTFGGLCQLFPHYEICVNCFYTLRFVSTVSTLWDLVSTVSTFWDLCQLFLHFEIFVNSFYIWRFVSTVSTFWDSSQLFLSSFTFLIVNLFYIFKIWVSNFKYIL